ncbi:MAG: cysteine--tRNA ligase [Pseudomonadota bacterium]
MVEITLFNSMSRQKERLEPITPGKVSMYVCGPTVYDRAHIGNARPAVVFDTLYRLLRHSYGAENVTYVRNFTDVDDKINARALQMSEAGDTRPLTEIVRTLSDTTIEWYLEDMGALGVMRPNHEPRATEFIGEMVTFIEALIDKGHAYAADGHVLFEVGTDPDYGSLARRNLDDMIAGARVEVAPYKRSPMDFVLWKPSNEHEPGWPSPWGLGRPGWHIECSAMAKAILGESLDIHGGGIDLQFPHHENECAQSRCAHPESKFASIWMHNGFLQVEGEKMSKSLGNFFTVKDLRDKGIPGEVIRFVLLSAQYRQPIDWTEKRADEARKTLTKWRRQVEGVTVGEVSPVLLDRLSDDLNTPGAIAELHALSAKNDAPALLASAQLLGLLSDDLGGWDAAPTLTPEEQDFLAQLETTLLERRKVAMETKDFSAVDALRAALIDAGLSVKISKTEVAFERQDTFDSQKLFAIEP